MDLYLW